MERIEGEVIVTSLPAALDTPAERRRIGEQLMDALVEIHGCDWRAVGLEGFGKPTGYLERQLRRFGGLWEVNKTREIPAVESVGGWLAENLPGVSARRRSSTATTASGNTIFASGAPARLAAVLDWEMATIGDPLADIGYLCMMWTEAGDPSEGLRAHLGNVTRAEGFLTRAEMIARYEERSGARSATSAGTRRSPSGRAWCSWRATTSARSPAAPTIPTCTSSATACSSSPIAPRRWPSVTDDERRRSALLIDWGGVLTTNLFASFHDHCVTAGIDPRLLANRFKTDPEARELLIALEKGQLAERDFEIQFAHLLDVGPEGLIDGLFAGVQPDEAMLGAVRAAHRAGIRTALVSNSWGVHRYPHDLFEELFDGVVISGEEGIRKPSRRMYKFAPSARARRRGSACTWTTCRSTSPHREARDGDRSPHERRDDHRRARTAARRPPGHLPEAVAYTSVGCSAWRRTRTAPADGARIGFPHTTAPGAHPRTGG